jgi:hypothetical protein
MKTISSLGGTFWYNMNDADSFIFWNLLYWNWLKIFLLQKKYEHQDRKNLSLFGLRRIVTVITYYNIKAYTVTKRDFWSFLKTAALRPLLTVTNHQGRAQLLVFLTIVDSTRMRVMEKKHCVLNQHAVWHFKCTVLRVDSTQIRVKSICKFFFVSITRRCVKWHALLFTFHSLLIF